MRTFPGRLRRARCSNDGSSLPSHRHATLYQFRALATNHERNLLSKIWIPTGGIAAAESEKNDSLALLTRAGFLRQSGSGIFHLLPLGLRVQEKIEALVDKHMRSVGASKVSLSSITSEALWKKSGRLSTDGKKHPEIYRLQDARGTGETGLLLSPTHEEEITDIVANAVKSYRDLPLRLYQTSRKYRNELRPRQGLLRAREFVMKDLYTFDLDVGAALKTYEEVRQAYANLFAELKIPYLTAEADSGDMGGSLSHEFHFASDAGEDTVFSCSHCGYVANEEKALSRIDEFEIGLRYCREPWIGIAEGGRDLVLAFCPTVEAPDGGARPVNWQALKRAVPGVMSDAVDPLKQWRSWRSPEDEAVEGGRHVFIVADYRVHHDGLPTDASSIMDVLGFDWNTTWPHDLPEEATMKTVDPASQRPLDLCSIRAGDGCPKCDSGTLRSQLAVELGHTFYLGTRYSEPLRATVSPPSREDPRSKSTDGQRVPLEMGCHGIGVSRLIGATASILADDKGLNWPRAIAPFEVVIVPFPGYEEQAIRLQDILAERQIDAVVDDRNRSPTWKLKDADLIGYPVLAVVSERTWTSGSSVEVQCRRLDGYKRDHSTTAEDISGVVESLLSGL